ncbi:LAME_0E02674g1_1 [Lachancea meyersii CBS 8951]|uniref:LAME_0E02674g1_1 n=1 Tax=Lachancea meyersii CBS 8951 TaxID=1266667 RepID=A0A1G4JFZ8_9SACH|nr:LAME_0E02674g1_1 [Lachancea meyersii CBS 8951]
MRRSTRTDPKKRHSMMVDTSGISSFAGFSSLYGSKTANRSLEDVAATTRKKSSDVDLGTRKSSALKRSTVLLDDNMVREYNLAVQSLTHDPLRTHQSPQTRQPVRKHQSSLSSSSSMSSLFSRDSAMSVQDLIFEEWANEAACEPMEPVQKGFYTEPQPQLERELELELAFWDNKDDEEWTPHRRTQLEFF